MLTSLEVHCLSQVRGEIEDKKNLKSKFRKSLIKINFNSDKTVRLFRWEVGSGFTEDKHSPYLGHKYAVTQAVFSPKVRFDIVWGNLKYQRK